MPQWEAALALLLAALALLALLARRLGRPWRRTVGATTLPRALVQDHEEEVDGGGPADQFSDRREPLPGGCSLICKPSALAQCLLRVLRRSAALEPGPRSWLSGPHLQTLCHFVLPVGPGPELAREYLQVADDGLVALDWVVGPCARDRRVSNAGGLPAVLLVIPNAWGRLTRNVLGLCLLALERGYYPVIFHRRGHHGCPLVSPRLQPFGDPSDLKEAVTYIRFRHPAAPLFAVSEGSGSALLLSYLGECGSSSYMTGAACISPVLRCREWFEAGLPWPYERGFLLHQKIALSRWVFPLQGGNASLTWSRKQLCLEWKQIAVGQFGQRSHTFSKLYNLDRTRKWGFNSIDGLMASASVIILQQGLPLGPHHHISAAGVLAT
jgi:abhydrolase domain-containing protein 15